MLSNDNSKIIYTRYRIVIDWRNLTAAEIKNGASCQGLLTPVRLQQEKRYDFANLSIRKQKV